MPTRQTVLQALVIALAWLACDALVRHFAWPVPASVVGMIALLLGLLSKRLPLSWVQAGAGFYLGDMLLFFTGASLMMVFSTVTSLVQLTAPNEMRGRVMSIYMLFFRGGMPLGSLASGWAATYIGAPRVLEINGVLLVAVAIYFLVRSHGVREI